MPEVLRSGPIRYATAARFGVPSGEPAIQPTSTAICPQPPSRLEQVMGPAHDPHPEDEDCLALSVVAPATPGPHPVIVFLHGGGFGTGSGLMAWYDGAALAAEQDVVVVSVSYRLGPFGYLVLDGVSPGNLGLLDQLAALRWVRDHVADYGGDPARVTLCGQSAGGISIMYLLELPEARTLVRRVIAQSAPLGLTRSRSAARLDAAAFVDHLDGDPASAPAQAMLAAFALTAADRRARTGDSMDPPFVPVRGAAPLAAQPAAAADLSGLDLLVGWNRDDMTAFGAPLERAGAASDEVYRIPWQQHGARLRQAGAMLTGYRLDWRPAGSAFGATHCVELPLLLGDEAAWRASPMLGTLPWTEVDRLGRQLRAVWARFAGTGQVSPNLAPDVPIRWDPSGELDTLAPGGAAFAQGAAPGPVDGPVLH